MSKVGVLHVAIALAVLGCWACDARHPVLDHASLANMEYTLPSPPPVRALVHDGKWSIDDAEGRRSLTVVDDNLRGDLDGDGLADAVVVLVYWGGGSGVFNYLGAVVNVNGKPEHVASVELGDRVQVQSVVVAKRQITANLVVQGENDAMCCPTQPVTRTYELVGGKLVQYGA